MNELLVLATSTTSLGGPAEIWGHIVRDFSNIGSPTALAAFLQVLMIDVIFSLDSVITAVGMTEGLKNPIPIMVTAIILSVMAMLVFSKSIVTFIERYPAIKILALSFLLLIGSLLVAEGFHHSIPKGYVYFAMAFSFVVETLQMMYERKRRVAVKGP